MGITMILLVVVIAMVIAFIAIYNALIRMRTRCEEAWSDIDVQLKRRYDLIPNLVNTVKGYAAHEKETLERVIQARNVAQAVDPANVAEKMKAENALSQTLRSIFALAENYPDLKANTNFLELQRELSDTENKIQAARRFYNGNVRDYNIKIATFPSNIIAGMFSFVKKEFFEVEDEKQRENVNVQF